MMARRSEPVTLRSSSASLRNQARPYGISNSGRAARSSASRMSPLGSRMRSTVSACLPSPVTPRCAIRDHTPWQAECQSMQPWKTGCFVSCRRTFRAGTSLSRSTQWRASERNARRRAATPAINGPGGGFLGRRLQQRDLRRKFSFWPVANSDTNPLALPEFANAAPAECFHMHEDVGRVGAPRYEAVAFSAVEPLHQGVETRPLRLREVARISLWGLRLGCRRRIVQGNQPASLQSFRTLHSLADDARPFISGLEARLPDAALVKKDIPLHRAARWRDKAIALGNVEPLYRTADLYGFTQLGGRRPDRIHPRLPQYSRW